MTPRRTFPETPGADSPAFEVEGRPVAWSTVVEEARRSGAWAAAEQSVCEGVACLAHARASGSGPSGAPVQQEAARFRQERRLTAAEDMEAWLGRWQLTVADWMDHIRRMLARDAHHDPAAALAEGQLPEYEGDDGDDETARRVWTTAVCSGALQRAASDLAGRLAVRAALTDGQPAPSGEDDPGTVMARFRAWMLTPERLDTELGSRPMDWMRLDTAVFTFRTRNAAGEARLCLVDDGLDPEQLCLMTGTAQVDRRFYLEDVHPEWRPALLGAHTGDVVGPLPAAAGWVLLVVHRRCAPSTADPEVRRRAEAALVGRAVRKEVDDRVVWRDGLTEEGGNE